MDIMNVLKVIIVIQLFYAIAITMVAYALVGTGAAAQITPFSDPADQIDIASVSGELEDSIQRQIDIPAVEVGALVFYSGNILLDLLMNFVNAIPHMIMSVLNAFELLFNFDTFIMASIQTFMNVIIMVMYFIACIQLLAGIRSGRVI